jgi:hypothetical protein
MAQDSIVGGLFGITPESLDLAQRQRDEAMAIQYAGLDPMQRAAYGTFLAGQQLGRGIGSLLGIEDPQLKMVTQRQQIMRGIDPNDPEALSKASMLASEMGDPRLAAVLAEQRRKALESQALVAQRTAAAKREQKTAIPTNIQEAQYVATLRNDRNQIAALTDSEVMARYGIEKTAALANIDAQLSQLVKSEKPESRSELQKLLDELALLDPVKDKKKYDALSGRINILTTRAPGTSVSVKLPPQENEFEKELGGVQAKRVGKSLENAESAKKSLDTLMQAKNILSQPVFTGPLANFQSSYGAALQSLGIKLKDNAVENTQAYGALMAKQTAEIIKNFGAGTGLSDADREYALKASGGEIRMTKEALLKIIDINERAARNAILYHNERVKNIKTNIPLTVDLPSSRWTVVK